MMHTCLLPKTAPVFSNGGGGGGGAVVVFSQICQFIILFVDLEDPFACNVNGRCINGHGIDLVISKYTDFSTRWVNDQKSIIYV